MASFPVCRMVELLEVSRSGYHAWVDRQDAPPGPRAARRAELAVQIVDFHQACDRVNGAPRILADLREAGEVVSRKTVAKIMAQKGIHGVSPRPWTPATTITDDSPHTLPDLVGRAFDPGRGHPVSQPLDRTVYNTRQRPSSIGQISPVQFENQHITAAQAASPYVHEHGSTPKGGT